ncbi:MAG: nicotinate-nucleotide adenylyltransferase [Rhodobacteraceae bacterium]|nr:nicotinate-nucleotide adenylyltransferase [Paracoccaceae bacterium]
MLGGSFNPAHGGHVHISMHAIKNLALDELWWMVSPCNPLKPLAANVPVHTRLERAASTVSHPRILVTDIEARFGTMYTVDTLRKLSMRRSGINVIWLMGSDCLVQMHLWKDWKRIFEAVPICVFSRPGELPRARNSVAARTFEASRMQQSEAARLGQMEPPAWVFATIPLHAGSSTEFRRVNGPLEHL